MPEDLFETAPHRRAHTMDLPVSAERVWAGLAASQPLWWCRALTTVEWTSPRPFGVGTTRRATVLGLLRFRERFVLWEEGRRMRFETEGMNLPLFHRFGEDCLVEPTESGCRFTWTFLYEPTAKLGNPVNDSIFRWLVADTRRHFAR